MKIVREHANQAVVYFLLGFLLVTNGLMLVRIQELTGTGGYVGQTQAEVVRTAVTYVHVNQ